MAGLDLIAVDYEDYRRLAQKRLPAQLFDYIDGGSYSEQTLRANEADFASFNLRQTVLKDISNINTKTSLFGDELSMPLVLAPIGLAGLMRRRAEVQAVKAADKTNIPFCLSTVSICGLEEIAKAAQRPFWFQLYMLKDKGAVKDLLQLAKNAGVKTLVFTVDLAVVGARYRDIRNGMGGGLSGWAKLRAGLEYPMHYKWFWDVAIKGRPLSFANLSVHVPGAKALSDFKDWIDNQFDPSCTWQDIKWLRQQWDGKIIIKGILNENDAKRAFGSGADAIVVSNHGGRQLDGVTSSIKTLPHIRKAIGNEEVILLDGGVRSGADILRAVALGADGVLIGRAWIYAIAAKGEKGLFDLLSQIKSELETTMALTGVTNIKDINEQVLDI